MKTIVKSIASVPVCAEGKNATCAHADLMGNLTAGVCDVWSNESVYNREEMGGPTPGVWLQSLGYECALMNTAKQIGTAKELRDSYVLADKYRDPQGVILAYDNAYKIGQAIVADGEDNYLRARAAALKAMDCINEAVDQIIKSTGDFDYFKPATEVRVSSIKDTLDVGLKLINKTAIKAKMQDLLQRTGI